MLIGGSLLVVCIALLWLWIRAETRLRKEKRRQGN